MSTPETLWYGSVSYGVRRQFLPGRKTGRVYDFFPAVCAVNARSGKRNRRARMATSLRGEVCPYAQVVAGSIPAAPTGAVRLFGCDERRRLAGARQWRRTPERMLPPGVEKGCSPPTSPLRPLSIAPAPLPSSLPLPQERGRGLFISVVQWQR